MRQFVEKVWCHVREVFRDRWENLGSNRLDWQYWQLRAQQEPDLDKREAIYREGLEQIPDDVWLAVYFGGFLAYDRRDHDRAERFYTEVLKLKPNNVPLNVAVANLLDARGDNVSAERLYREVHERFPDSFFALADFAAFLVKRKDCNEAGQLFEQAFKLQPKNAQLICNFATFQATCEKDYTEALNLYKTALELAPHDGSIKGAAAEFFHFLGDDSDKAERLYRSSTVSTAAHISNFARFMEDVRRDYDEAERLRQKALALEPTDVEAICGYAGFLMDIRHNHRKAERLYREAGKLEPGNAAVAVSLMELLIRQDRVPEAESLSLEIWTSEKDQVSQHAAFAAFFRGLLLRMDRRDDSAALAHLKTALASGPDPSSGDFDALMRASSPALSPADLKLYAALGAATLHPEKVPALDNFARWSAIEAAKPHA